MCRSSPNGPQAPMSQYAVKSAEATAGGPGVGTGAGGSGAPSGIAGAGGSGASSGTTVEEQAY